MTIIIIIVCVVSNISKQDLMLTFELAPAIVLQNLGFGKIMLIFLPTRNYPIQCSNYHI